MQMRKTLVAIGLVGALCGGLFGAGQPVQAVTVDELLAQITALKEQIISLQQQLGTTKPVEQAWCHAFNSNLRVGDSGKEVAALQEALSRSGFAVGNDQGQATFGEQTAAAVVGFQQKYASEVLAPYGLQYGTGFVGKSTRAKLTALYGCQVGTIPTPAPTPIPIRPVPPTPVFAIKVLSPNGGEKVVQGDSYVVTWQSMESRASSGKNVKITVCMTAASYAARQPLPESRCSNAMEIPDTGSYLMTTGAAAGIGDYLVRIENAANANVYDESDAPFQIIERASDVIVPSLGITVLYPTGGETLTKGSKEIISMAFSPMIPTGGFSMQLTNPSDLTTVAQLKYCGAASADATTNSYNSYTTNLGKTFWTWMVGYDADRKEIPNGSYQITVYDCGNKDDTVWSGGSVTARSNTFRIVSAAQGVVSMPNMVYPQDGQTLGYGAPNQYLFKVTQVAGATGYLFGFFQNGVLVYENWRDDKQLSRDGEFGVVPGTYGYSRLQQGDVEVWVRAYNGSVWSDPKIITIHLVPTGTQASGLRVISPNGGETLTVGQQYTIRWSASPDIKWVDISLQTSSYPGVDSIGTSSSNRVGNIMPPILAQQGSVAWTVDQATLDGYSLVGSEKYFKISITGYKDNMDGSLSGFVKRDASDSAFSISSGHQAGEVTSFSATPISGGAWQFSWTSRGADSVKFWIPCESISSIEITNARTGQNFACGERDPMAATGSINLRLRLTSAQSANVVAYAVPLVAGVANKDGMKSQTLQMGGIPVPNPSLSVISPNGGETLEAGKTYRITWDSYGANQIGIEVIGSGDVKSAQIAFVDSIPRYYDWTVPTNLSSLGLDVDNLKIRIFDKDSGLPQDSSDGVFRITKDAGGSTGSSPSIKIVSPNGGEVVMKGEPFKITWTGGVSTWSIGISLINEQITRTVKTLVASTANDGSEMVTIPSDVPAGSYVVYVEGCRNCGTYPSPYGSSWDYSDASFRVTEVADAISPVISNGLPNGLVVASSQNTTLSVETNEKAKCLFSNTPGQAYNPLAGGVMDMANAAGTKHEGYLRQVLPDRSYTYYVRCKDESGNMNTEDYKISFSVSAPQSVLSCQKLLDSIQSGFGLTKLEQGFSVMADIVQDGVIDGSDFSQYRALSNGGSNENWCSTQIARGTVGTAP